MEWCQRSTYLAQNILGYINVLDWWTQSILFIIILDCQLSICPKAINSSSGYLSRQLKQQGKGGLAIYEARLPQPLKNPPLLADVA